MSKHPTTAVAGVTADDVSWIAGKWRGHYGNDEVEEQWSEALGGVMMGMFRWLRDGKVRFYEFILMENDGDQFMMRWKHFAPDLIGWEDKDKFTEGVLVSLSEGEAVFLQSHQKEPTWLIYKLEDVDRLVVHFESDGKAHALSDKFVFSRQG